MLLRLTTLQVVLAPWSAEISQGARSIVFEQIEASRQAIAESAVQVASLVQSIGDEADPEVMSARYHLELATTKLVALREAVDMVDPLPDPHEISSGPEVSEIIRVIAIVSEKRRKTLISRISKAASTLFDTVALDTEPISSLFNSKNKTDANQAIKDILAARLEMGLIAVPNELLAVPIDPWACLPDLDLFDQYNFKKYDILSAFLAIENLTPKGLALAQKVQSFSEASTIKPTSAEASEEGVVVSLDLDDIDGRANQRIALMVESATKALLTALHFQDETVHARTRYLVMWLLASGDKNPMAHFQRHLPAEAIRIVSPFVAKSVATLQPNLWTRIWHRIIKRRCSEEVDAAGALNTAARSGDIEAISQAADNLIQIRLKSAGSLERLLRVPLDPWLVVSQSEKYRIFVDMHKAIHCALTRTSFADTADGIRLIAELDVCKRKAAVLEENEVCV